MAIVEMFSTIESERITIVGFILIRFDYIPTIDVMKYAIAAVASCVRFMGSAKSAVRYITTHCQIALLAFENVMKASIWWRFSSRAMARDHAITENSGGMRLR